MPTRTTRSRWRLAVQGLAGSTPPDNPFWHDPYVVNWGQTDGRVLDTVIVNRYGAKLNARLYGPKLPLTDLVSGRISNGPFPTVIFIPGYGGMSTDSANDHFSAYEGALEQLAENGYIVLAVSPQGQGGSEQFAPPSPYCDPNGSWKQPQELGMMETGPCAGQQGDVAPPTGPYADLFSRLAALPVPLGLAETAAFLAYAHLDPKYALGDAGAAVEGPRFAFPAWDAVVWALSPANPWRAQIDGERFGVLGHSAGAQGVIIAGNGDPLRRFKVAIAWDTFGNPPDTMSPTVPTLAIQTELQPLLGPYIARPHDEYFAGYRLQQRFMADRRDSMLITLRGSNHYDCGYTPAAFLDPNTQGPLQNISSKGQQVCVYYTLAWLDRWLKGATTAHPRGDEAAQLASAHARLLARTFDDSADRTALGQGTYDLLTRKNVPYKIAGERIADHLTFFLHSQLSFDGVTCLDWQAGCP